MPHVDDANVRIQQGLCDANNGRVAQIACEGGLQDDLAARALRAQGGELLLQPVGQLPLDLFHFFSRNHVVDAAKAVAAKAERAGRDDLFEVVSLDVPRVGAGGH